MTIWWLGILAIYGLVTGWDFSPLMWWLLVPMLIQDAYDVNRKKG
jgi:hypothetical protein